ncbi:MAG TPA: hypothetical protein VKA14_10160, partial [Gammaproteobacteria bacterium]|nr:hypothetical protein [Gammaproteobacteria bacterium]
TLQSYVPADQDRKLAILQETGLLVPPSALQPASTEAAPGPGELEAALEGFTATAARAARAPPAPGLAPVLKELAGALRQFHDAHGRDPAALQALQQRVIGTLPAELSHLAVGLQARRVTLEALPASLRNQYIAPDGRARIEVFSRHPLDNSTRLVNFVSAVHQVIPDAAGTPVLFVEGGRTVVSAFREASVLSVVLIAALLGLTLRRTMDVLQIMAPLLMSGIVTVAAMVLLGIDFNLANIIVLPLLIGLGVAFAIYVVLRWRSGLDIEAIMHSSTPGGVLFSALTTLSSFGSLAIAPDPGMAVLGRTLAVALAVVLVSVMLVLPASLALVPQPGPRRGPPPTE